MPLKNLRHVIKRHSSKTPKTNRKHAECLRSPSSFFCVLCGSPSLSFLLLICKSVSETWVFKHEKLSDESTRSQAQCIYCFWVAKTTSVYFWWLDQLTQTKEERNKLNNSFEFMKAMEIFLTAYSFMQSSGSSWEHKATTSIATSSGENWTFQSGSWRRTSTAGCEENRWICYGLIYNLTRAS